MNDLERKLVDGLHGFADAMENDTPEELEKKYWGRGRVTRLMSDLKHGRSAPDGEIEWAIDWCVWALEHGSERHKIRAGKALAFLREWNGGANRLAEPGQGSVRRNEQEQMGNTPGGPNDGPGGNATDS